MARSAEELKTFTVPTKSTFHSAAKHSRRKHSSKAYTSVKAPSLQELLTKSKPVELEAYKIGPVGKP